MTAGTWTSQNKVRPGVYVNTQGEGQRVGTLGDRGVVAFPATLPWGKEDGVITLDAESYFRNALSLVGYRAGDPRIRHITSAMNHARKVLVYRVNGEGSQKAKATIGGLTATAKYGGVRGNDLTVVVQANIDSLDEFDVSTYLEGDEVDLQTVEQVSELQNNNFVEFSGEGPLEETAGKRLEGGADGEMNNGMYSKAFDALEAEEWHVMGVPTEEEDIKELAAAFIERLRNSGQKAQVVLHDYDGDNEGVINLRNSIVLADDEKVPAIHLLWEIAAMEAAAAINESLTYTVIPNAVDVHPKLTNDETVRALRNGELVLTARNGRVVIEQDINSLTSFTPTKPQMFSKNRVIRVLDGINNDFVRIFGDHYIGKVNNDADGRNLFKAEIIGYMENLQDIGAIQNFNSQTDVIVEPGEQVDGVYAEVYIQPVDSLEKFYFNIYVRQGDVSVSLGGAA